MRSFSFFFFTLSGITLMRCLWLSPVKFSRLNFSYFVQHPIKRADDPLLTKTFIREIGFFISNPSWFKIDVRPSARWAETGWRKNDMGLCERPALCDVSGSFIMRRIDSGEAGFTGSKSETEVEENFLHFGGKLHVPVHVFASSSIIFNLLVMHHPASNDADYIPCFSSSHHREQHHTKTILILSHFIWKSLQNNHIWDFEENETSARRVKSLLEMEDHSDGAFHAVIAAQ